MTESRSKAEWQERSKAWATTTVQGKSQDDNFNQMIIAEAAIKPGEEVLDIATGGGNPAVSTALSMDGRGSVTCTDEHSGRRGRLITLCDGWRSSVLQQSGKPERSSGGIRWTSLGTASKPPWLPWAPPRPVSACPTQLCAPTSRNGGPRFGATSGWRSARGGRPRILATGWRHSSRELGTSNCGYRRRSGA